MANYDFDQNHGKIKRLYPDSNQLYFTLGGAGVVTAMHPTDGYYFIPRANPNYATMSELVFLCAEHSWVLKVRTQPALVGGHAEVVYLVVDFTP